jgi:nitrate reductase assembly molybdenum cofactor insertion protein NarJ
MKRPHYELFADLVSYPTAELPRAVSALRTALRGYPPEAEAELARFAEQLRTSSPLSDLELEDMQELFTRSFDIQSITTLYVGYVAFGDDYKRGELLVNLNRELRDVGVEIGCELSDHLANVLRLVARWEDEEAVAELVSMVLSPSLERMVAEFATERISAREALYKKHYKTLIETSDRAAMYQHVLRALVEVLRREFIISDSPLPEASGDFLGSIKRELEIEARGEGYRSVGRTP